MDPESNLEYPHDAERVSQDRIIKLNIGGVRYTTSRTTLVANSSYFSTLIDGNFPSKKDEKNAFFIDRDGQYFSPILEYLRTGELVIPPNMEENSVLREADFYGVGLQAISKEGNLPIMDDGVYYLVNKKENDVYFYFYTEKNHVLCQSFRSNLPLWNITHSTNSSCFISIQASGLSYNVVYKSGILFASGIPCCYRNGKIGTISPEKIFRDKDERCIIFADKTTLYIFDKSEFGWCCCNFQTNSRGTLHFEVVAKNRKNYHYWIIPFGAVLVLINHRHVGTVFL